MSGMRDVFLWPMWMKVSVQYDEYGRILVCTVCNSQSYYNPIKILSP